MGVCQSRGLGNLLAGSARSAVNDVLPNRGTEKQRLLKDEPNLPPQRLQSESPHVLAVNADCPGVHFIKAGDQADDCRLAGSRRSDECGHLPRVNLEADIFRSEERRVGKECRSRWSPYH